MHALYVNQTLERISHNHRLFSASVPLVRLAGRATSISEGGDRCPSSSKAYLSFCSYSPCWRGTQKVPWRRGMDTASAQKVAQDVRTVRLRLWSHSYNPWR